MDRTSLPACGGLSYSQTGSDGSGFDLVRSRDHQIVSPYPALTSLIGARSTHRILAGITITATVTAKSETEQSSFRGGFLFSHRGYSGPAISNTSTWSLGPASTASKLRSSSPGPIARKKNGARYLPRVRRRFEAFSFEKCPTVWPISF
ncbi:NAD(P)/FAD-dependent oxidoreductase [Candidatus Bipolaricaulota bacterium]|nr:NAD(P)/FAD-dependent oxidoreductase [Candidatus Bipolaricaulota bacterium]